MPDPAVFGSEAADDGFRGQHTYRPAETAATPVGAFSAEAMRRAYLGHGDQLGALEAEAYRDQARPRRRAALIVLRATLAGWAAGMAVLLAWLAWQAIRRP